MKSLLVSLSLIASAHAYEIQTYKLTKGSANCPLEMSVIKTEKCLELSMLNADADVSVEEYCKINSAPQTTEVVDEEKETKTVTVVAQYEIQNRFVFTNTTTTTNKYSVVTKTNYSEKVLALGEKTATMTVRERAFVVAQLPKHQTLACFYSTDAE